MILVKKKSWKRIVLRWWNVWRQISKSYIFWVYMCRRIETQKSWCILKCINYIPLPSLWNQKCFEYLSSDEWKPFFLVSFSMHRRPFILRLRNRFWIIAVEKCVKSLGAISKYFFFDFWSVRMCQQIDTHRSKCILKCINILFPSHWNQKCFEYLWEDIAVN